ncbi:MAG: hypothetical protein ACXVAX_04905 [Pseudobdellovibrio sp.]
MKKKVLSIAGLTLGFAIGLTTFVTTYTRISTQRDPAALNGKVYEISNLTSAEIKAQLKKKFKVSTQIQGLKNLSFAGFSSALCKTYPQIEVEFVAEGVSVAGDAPELKVTSPCAAGTDPAEIGSIQIPIDKLLAEKAKNAEYKFEGYNSTLTLKNSADEWPHQWVLKRIEFKAAAGENKQVSFDRSPASVNEEAPIVLEF